MPPAERGGVGPRSTTALATGAWESLFRAQVTLMRRFDAEDAWDPLGRREYDVLFTLSRCPDGRLRLRDLNREILLAQPSLSRMVERLETAGLVRREADPQDRRGTVVALTEAGGQIQRGIGRRHAAQIRRLVGTALDREELETLERLCDKLRSAQKED
ncbi:winged helix-turn-helix transcriptional regulator [Rhodococcus spelaei]|uniref:Winged helix-turn-helix transcriptional regulator n=1 Tax=Rhodococcus spelaei TaxID=2546320 RepID=A0A541B8Q7_9NOCA|nr:MarR family winged helix-turn-helix transcriptional regulator [Rhodococcus spelaei]TQF68715.1 winged helix-turn-helix transcriptional regulator [Rhodococcus spelaei]